MKETKLKPGFGYHFLAVCVVLALSGVAMIPAAMAYGARTFSGAGLPAWLSELVSIVILLAPGIAVLVTGLTRVFGVTDTEHANALTLAATLEGLACGAEIIAALIGGGDDWLSRLGRILALAAATGFVFAALVITLSKNGIYKLTILEREQKLMWQQTFSQLLQAELETDSSHQEMRRAAQLLIRDETERQAGRRLYTRGETDGTGQGDRTTVQPTEQVKRLEEFVSPTAAHNGNGHPK